MSMTCLYTQLMKVKSGGFARLREAGYSRAFIIRQGLKEGRLLYSVTFNYMLYYIIRLLANSEQC